MSSALTDLCINLQNSTDRLEEELKKNIADCHKLLIENKANETKLALEKAKDYHYKEVLDILKEIVSNIRRIIFHEEKIRKLNDETSVTSDELKRYSYVQRQVQAFSNKGEVVMKRERRRVASEISLESLDDWEMYLDKKKEEENLIQVEPAPIPKRNNATNRKKKKFVSSTFNNFLDKNTSSSFGSLNSIIEDEYSDLNERLARVDTDSTYSENSVYESVNESGDELGNHLGLSIESLTSIYESETDDQVNRDEQNQSRNLSTLDILETINQENEFEAPTGDTKPKIVEVIYKKKPD